MNRFDDVSADVLLAGRGGWIESELQSALAAHPLDCIDTEYPHWVGAVDSADGHRRPAERHPVFYGCFDWHSAVHSHWSLVRQLRLFDDHPRGAEIQERLDDRFTDDAVAREVEEFESNPSFEEPYGWAWLLRLAAELRLWDDPLAAEWRETLRPLEDQIAALVASEFLPAERPIRVGTHDNSAFALAAVVDYARVVGDGDLEAEACDAARRFYLDDEAYPFAYEPLGWDFLSPGLTEADLLRRVLGPDAFATWLDGFVSDPRDALPDPVAVDADSPDGMVLHLVGLNLSRAWSLAGLADALDGGATERDGTPFAESAARHAAAGLERAFTDDYAGAHWLTSFVLYLLTRNDGGIAP